MQSEQQLWCAVISRAFEDAAGATTAIGDPRQRQRARAEAHDWFTANGHDFQWICDAAGFESDVVRASVLDRLPALGRSPKHVHAGEQHVHEPQGSRESSSFPGSRDLARLSNSHPSIGAK
jgi:hypothetical protein